MAQFNRICRMVDATPGDQVLEELTLYLSEALKGSKQVGQSPIGPNRVLRRRQMRRQEYAKMQYLWRKNSNKCLRYILKDVKNAVTPSKDPFWETVMTQDTKGSPGIGTRKEVITKLWDPITPREIKGAMPENSTSPGPDGVTASQLRGVPMNILIRVYNTLLWCGRAPRYLLKSRTTMIPKKEQAYEPGDFRPIAVSSVIIRALNKILATRMLHLVELDDRQKAFRDVDGCAEYISDGLDFKTTQGEA